MWGIPVFLFLITKGGVVIRMLGTMILLRSGLGLGNSLGLPTSPGLHDCLISLSLWQGRGAVHIHTLSYASETTTTTGSDRFAFPCLV